MGYRQVQIERFGGPEQLHVVEKPEIPKPGVGEVRLRVLACGVGYTDTKVREGKYVEYRGGVPMTPGFDVVGMVDAVGEGVALKVGTVVADLTVTGGYTQYLIRPAVGLVAVPGGVSPPVAVCVPLIWMTAWQMLTRYRTPAAGETVLVVGAAGSTGRALVALAQHLGLNVVGSCSHRDIEKVRALGAEPVDYRTEGLADAIRTAAGHQPITMAFDAAGGKSWNVSRSVLAKKGLLVAYGVENPLDAGESMLAIVLQTARVLVGWNLLGRIDGSGLHVVLYNISWRRKKHGDDYLEDASTLLSMLAAGTISPEIARIDPMSGAAQAHRDIEAGGMAGRIVLDPWAQ